MEPYQSSKFLEPLFDGVRQGAISLTESEVVKAVESKVLKPTDSLFHYTTSAGLIGIIESHCLHATNYRFLNDSGEFRYGVERVTSILKELARDATSETGKQFAKSIENSFPMHLNRVDCFVACFSQERDDLNQWRQYADDGAGFAIEFSRSDLVKSFPANVSAVDLRFDLRRVIYCLALQYKVVSHFVLNTQRLLEQSISGRSEADCDSLGIACKSFVKKELLLLAIAFKARDFASENEWRLFAFTYSAEIRARFRRGIHGVTPFTEYIPGAWAQAQCKLLPITGVMYGSRHDRELVENSVGRLLRNNSYHIPMTQSKSPIRRGL